MPSDQAATQAVYHRSLYHALWNWPETREPATGSHLRGVDMLGHFGAPGCDLILDSIVAYAPSAPVRLAEIGSGMGGVLRYLIPELAGQVPVALAVGCELVEEHCRLAMGMGAPAGGQPVLPVCTSAQRMGIRTGALDVAFASGAASHFRDMGAVLTEAHRVLRPAGLLTFTEEVSLFTAEPSAEFRRLHPPAVFASATWEQRRAQLGAAGFTGIVMRDLSEWAATLLHRRLLALRVQRRAVAAVYGEAEAQRIADTLAAARAEILAGRLRPAHVTAIA
jgi:SAM-dependent methyltransferase